MASSADGGTVTLAALAELLAPSLGEEKAKATIDDAARALGLHGPEVPNGEAMRILEHVSETPGIVGTVARFAKARFILLHPST